MSLLRELWDYRGFIKGSVKREFQLNYQNSMLGAAWTIINPLAMIVVYTLIFSQVMKARLPGNTGTFSYSIFLCAGLFTWIRNANLIKKLSFPRITLPVIVVINALINFSIGFTLFVIFLIISGNFPGWVFITIFPILILQLVFSIGVGIILGILNVFFRDVGQLYGVVLQFWFWLTPIVYSPSIIPDKMRFALKINPMASIMKAYQGIFVEMQIPEWHSLIFPAVLGIVFCLLGLRLYTRCSADMVDEL